MSEIENPLREAIAEAIRDNDVILFMKGVPEAPACGFSARATACLQALDLFASIYGAEAGNLALKALAVGGVYVGGGIAPKIRPKLEAGRFVAAFRDKGRFASLMAGIPVALALDPRAPLWGAARIARELAGDDRA